MNKRRIALITGWSLVLMAIVAAFSFGYALAEFNLVDQVESLKENILSKQGLYLNMLIGILIILFLDLLVSYTLYEYFKHDNRKISLISSVIRIIYTLIFAIATYYLWKNLSVHELTNQSINRNFQLFESAWYGGLVIFGLHILLIGFLMKLHKRIPKVLWYLTLIAGVSYVIIHVLKLTSPNSEFVNTLEMILMIPMAIGELGLAIWLLLKGGKEKKIANETSY